jgi:hypothetical protein
VDGQRLRPSAPIRFDLLKLVGSKPALIAKADKDIPLLSAKFSIPVQISEYVNCIALPFF